jgi:hypothetical protein
MTPQEIQALINAKIAGQGSAVDVGGALPQILSEILTLAQSGVNAAKLLTIPNFTGAKISAETKEGFCELLGITTQQFDGLISGEYTFVKFPLIDETKTNLVSIIANNKYLYCMEFSTDPDGGSPTACAQMTWDGEFSIIEC